MPVTILTATQRAEWERFPEEIDDGALNAFFIFGDDELAIFLARRTARLRFALAAEVAALRWLGFIPADLAELPAAAARLICQQLGLDPQHVDPGGLGGERHLIAERQADAMAISGFRACLSADLKKLEGWVADRALEHDGPRALLRDAADRLRRQSILRPGLTVLERLVARARRDAERKVYRRVQPMLDRELVDALDALLAVEGDEDIAAVTWLGQETATVGKIADALDRLLTLRALGAERWNLQGIPANRRRLLAAYVRHATAQALRRRGPKFRYPALLAFCAEAAARTTDEVVELLCAGLGAQHAKAANKLIAHKLKVADSANSSVLLLAQLLEVLLDFEIPDQRVREEVWRRAAPEQLQLALELAGEIARPEGDSHLAQLGERYSAVRAFAPRALAALDLRAGPDGEYLLGAVEILRELDRRGARKLPDGAPVAFVPRSWRPYVLPATGGIDRRHWELCLLSQLRGALDAGEIWVGGSRRHTDPELFLIPRADWPTVREDIRHELDAPPDATIRLEELTLRTARHVQRLDGDLRSGQADVEIAADGALMIRRLRAQPRDPETDELAAELAAGLPQVDLPELLVDVDAMTGFTGRLTHAGGANPRRDDHHRHLIAVIIAHACNLGITRMARSAGMKAGSLGWTSEWYLRHETLEAAVAAVVDYQATIPLAQHFGPGTHSSSDGKRRIVNPLSQHARSVPRYFGRQRGVTHYAFVSDQHTHFATRVIRTTVRDATYVLDGILDNQTQLPIKTHSTDTAGYSDVIFGLFDLLGLRFAPRLAGLKDTRLWHTGAPTDTPAGRLVGHRVDIALIAEQWDEMLRVAGSLKRGTIPASLLVGRLHAQQRRSRLAAALQDYGRLVKTEFALRYLTHSDERREIGRQLNKQESINALEDRIFYGREGKITAADLDRQSTQAAALALVASAIVSWNTQHLNARLDRLRAAGRLIDDEQLARLSPALSAHILINGRYHIPDPPDHLQSAPRVGTTTNALS